MLKIDLKKLNKEYKELVKEHELFVDEHFSFDKMSPEKCNEMRKKNLHKFNRYQFKKKFIQVYNKKGDKYDVDFN